MSPDSPQSVFVGIDVSKTRLDVSMSDGDSEKSFAVDNDPAGVGDLIARLQPLNATRIVLEATGR